MQRGIFFAVILFLAACSQGSESTESQPKVQKETIIDWVDFIKVNNEQYEALHTAVITDDTYIGDETAEIKFKVNENIDNPNYQIKNGDAAFLEEGTVLYSVKDRPDLIAVKERSEVNGYRLYQKDSKQEMWRFEHVDKELITKIEIWKEVAHPKLMNTISNEKEIENLLEILENSKHRGEDNYYEENPVAYDIVFYQGGPIAYCYPLLHHKEEWYWLPWEEEILTDGIEEFIGKEKVN